MRHVPLSTLLLLLLCQGAALAAPVSQPSAAFQNLSDLLAKRPELRIVGVADGDHGSAFPVRGLLKMLPTFLEWGMTSLVVESWDISSDCLNAYTTSNPQSGLQLEDFCEPARYDGRYRGEEIMGLRGSDSTVVPTASTLRRNSDIHRVYAMIRNWNWSHTRKVRIRPTDDAMRNYNVFMRGHAVHWTLPHVNPVPDMGWEDLGGHDLGEFLEGWHSKLIAKPYALWVNPAYSEAIATEALRAAEDHFNFARFPFYRDPNEKIVVFYGAAHIGTYDLPGTIDGMPLSFIIKHCIDVFGRNRVLALAPVTPSDSGGGTALSYNSAFFETLSHMEDGLYAGSSFDERPVTELGYAGNPALILQAMELPEGQQNSVNGRPDNFDFFLVAHELQQQETN